MVFVGVIVLVGVILLVGVTVGVTVGGGVTPEHAVIDVITLTELKNVTIL